MWSHEAMAPRASRRPRGRARRGSPSRSAAGEAARRGHRTPWTRCSRRRSPCSTSPVNRPDLPRPGRSTRRRGRQHLLVRRQQGRAAGPRGRPRARRRPQPPSAMRSAASDADRGRPQRPAHHRGHPVRRDRRPPLARRLLHARHRGAAQRPTALRAARDSRCCGSTSPPASVSTRCRRSSASSSAPRPTWARSRPRRCDRARSDRDEYLAAVRRAVAGRSTPSEFPFVHHIVDEFAAHNDSRPVPGRARPAARRPPTPGRELMWRQPAQGRLGDRLGHPSMCSGDRKSPLLTSPQVRGPFALVAAGEGFEPSELSRRIYSRTAVRL